MTTALTPALALDYVRELSADVIAGVVLDARGALLAGPQALAAPARALLAVDATATELHGESADGAAFAARDASHAIVIATGRFPLPSVTRRDLRTALTALGAAPGRESLPGTVPPSLVAALVHAARETFRPYSVNSRSDCAR